MKQMSLFKKEKFAFGGTLHKGKRKTKRPLNLKMSHHFVLKAATPFILLRNTKQVEQILAVYARKFDVRIYSQAVHSDHIHLSLKIKNRESYKKWIRAVTSLLVRQINGLKFKYRPWSRPVHWGQAYQKVQRYIALNRIEGTFVKDALKTLIQFRSKSISALHEPQTITPRKPLYPL